MLGYYNNLPATMKAFRNLWLHTGDAGFFDDCARAFHGLPMKSKSPIPSRALRHVYHAVYLQLLPGFMLSFIAAIASVEPHHLPMDENVRLGAQMIGGVLLFSGINIWLYLRRYEKALLAEAPKPEAND